MSHDTLQQTTWQVEVEELLRLRARLFPPYNVILYNDDYNDMLYVVAVLMRTIDKLTQPEAEQIMLNAHLHGSAVVVSCPRERAEHYQEQLLGYGLTATIEAE